MSLDRFVYWREQPPTQRAIGMLLRDYMGGAGKVRWSAGTGRYFIDLPGHCSSPTWRVGHVGRSFEPGMKRWIEVCLCENWADVITREGDDFTNGIAERLADVLARAFDRKAEPS